MPARSSSSKETRPARSCSKRPSACSTATSSASTSSSSATTSRSRTGARRGTPSSARRRRRSVRTALASKPPRSHPRDGTTSARRTGSCARRSAAVIVRTGRRIPGVVPLGGVHAPISIVRMAVGDAYGAREWRDGEGDDEVAFRTERIERRICRAVSEYAFRLAERTGAKVFGGPKYTVSPVYEGMLKEEMDAAAERHPDVPYEPQLIDATFALLVASAGDPLVIPALNRDGDILADLVLPLFGSIAGSESVLVAFDEEYQTRALMAEAAHGTAPSLQGKNVANPMAMILGGAALLSHIDDDEARAAGRAVREACLEAVSAGMRTADLGGH